jgi:Transposase DDE domain
MFRWFVGLSMDASVWNVTVFTKNRDRLLEGDIARRFLAAILVDPQVKPLLSDDHFSVDGTMIEAWASMKSCKPKDGSGEAPAPGRNGEVDFRGKPRSNETHASTTDPDARLYKKAAGQAARLCHLGHVLMENTNGLVVTAALTKATGTAEREAAIEIVGALEGSHRITVGGDKAYDAVDFVAEMHDLGATPHVAQNTNGRRSAIDGRTTRHRGDGVSQRKRKRIEEVFGWIKSSAGFRKTRHKGTERVGWPGRSWRSWLSRPTRTSPTSRPGTRIWPGSVSRRAHRVLASSCRPSRTRAAGHRGRAVGQHQGARLPARNRHSQRWRGPVR